MANQTLKPVDRIEILTLQDNYIEITAMDKTAIVTRAFPLKDGYFRQSVLSEHGFSAVVRTMRDGKTGTLLFDFGFSEEGAAYNARILGADLSRVDAVVLSHGHNDHSGGFDKLSAMMGALCAAILALASPGRRETSGPCEAASASTPMAGAWTLTAEESVRAAAPAARSRTRPI